MRTFISTIALVLVLLCQGCVGTGRHRTLGADALQKMDSLVEGAIHDSVIPGAVLCIVRGEDVIYKKAFGNRSLVPQILPMTEETVFDLASLSKCVGTTMAAMRLMEHDSLGLEDKVTEYIPEFLPWQPEDGAPAREITVRDLMTHSSGLDAYLDDVPACVERFGGCEPDSLMRFIALESGRNFKPGTEFLYSCLNFITLQNIIQRITQQRLCDYVQENVFDVLGMTHTFYSPLDKPVPSHLTIAPTEVQEDGLPLLGRVHDPIALLLNGGNSGNAGVFSNADDLSVICAAIMNQGKVRGTRVLKPETVELMTSVPEENDPNVGRALGWDVSSSHAHIRGELLPAHRCICHTGYTGTSIVMDLDAKVAIILLANRVHPYDTGSLGTLRARISDAVAEALVF